jgi:hypothetical protein
MAESFVIDGPVSQWSLVTSSAPPRKHSGSFIFVICINDLPEIIPNETNTALYADDTILHRSISSLSKAVLREFFRGRCKVISTD